MLNSILVFMMGVFSQSFPNTVHSENYSNQILVKFCENLTDAEKNEILDVHVPQRQAVHFYENIPNLALISFSNRTSSEEVCDIAQTLEEDDVFEFVEQDRLFVLSRSEVIPNDPGFSQSWGHRNIGQNGGLNGFDMKSTNAWDITQGSPNIRVMIFETGVQMNHPDLNMAEERDFTTGAVNGIPGSGLLNACDNHGTCVAGVISGKINNSMGTVGLSPLSPVVSAKVGSANVPCNGTWFGQTSWTINALNWAVSNNIRVTNNSNNYGFYSNSLNYAYSTTKNSGLVHFASSGNDGTNSIGYPAAYSSVKAIGSVNRFGQLSDFSNYGSGLFMVAPGESIYTTDRTGSIGYSSSSFVTIDGTSFSSPYAASLAALILSKNPNLTPNEVTSIMKESGTDLGTNGFDSFTGWGMINAYSALVNTPSPYCEEDLTQDGNVDGADLAVLLGEWGVCDGCLSDINEDNQVGGADLSLVLSAWGSCE